jgi:hypothetical protein
MEFIGAAILWSLIGVTLWVWSKYFTFVPQDEKYEYVIVTSWDGIEIEKVIDLQDTRSEEEDQ